MMRTLIFDLSLRLRGITDTEDAQAGLLELDAARCIDRSTETLDPEDWNFIRVADEVADEMVAWQDCGSPSIVSPLKDMAAWRRWKERIPDG